MGTTEDAEYTEKDRNIDAEDTETPRRATERSFFAGAKLLRERY